MSVLPPPGSDEPGLPPEQPDPLPPEAAAEPEIGEFSRGTGVSRMALARYLVARAVMRAIDQSMYLIALVITGLALAVFFLWLKWLGILLFLAALAVLAFRALFMAVLRRIAGPLWSIEDRVKTMVGDSRDDLFAELKRVGLPHHTITLPLLAFRLIGRRRQPTLQRIRDFELDRVIPQSRIDELHLIVENDLIGRRRSPGPADPGAG